MDGSSASQLWQRAWDEAQSSLEGIRERLSSGPQAFPRPVRVGQLDAELLDQDLVTLLKEPIKNALSLMKSSWPAQFDLEITVIIQALIYKFSIWDSGASYGAKLQDLRFKRPRFIPGNSYAPSGLRRDILLLHATLTVLVPYLQARLQAKGLSESWPDAPRSDWRRQAWEFLTRVERLRDTLGLMGLIVFFVDARYRTIPERLLGLRLIPARRVVSRNVNYEFMNRQMVWHAFTEFLLFMLPLINMKKLRRKLDRAVKSISWRFSVQLKESQNSSTESKKRGPYAMLPEGSCAICASSSGHSMSEDAQDSSSTGDSIPLFPINIPYVTSCDHTYCYYCLADVMLRAADDEEPGWECLRCLSSVTEARRVEVEAHMEEDTSGMESSIDSDDFPSSLSIISGGSNESDNS
ncbi:peroxisome assembly protein (Peroxin-2) [Tulasnella sp. 419]|nr:peroxisome assembly protein (Peroxin-2) [Tulasnella sp. 419]